MMTLAALAARAQPGAGAFLTGGVVALFGLLVAACLIAAVAAIASGIRGSDKPQAVSRQPHETRSPPPRPRVVRPSSSATRGAPRPGRHLDDLRRPGQRADAYAAEL